MVSLGGKQTASLQCPFLPAQLLDGGGHRAHIPPQVSLCLPPSCSWHIPLPSWPPAPLGLPHPLPAGHQGLLLPLQASHIVVLSPFCLAATHPHSKTTLQTGSRGCLCYPGSCLYLLIPAYPLSEAFHLHISGRTMVAPDPCLSLKLISLHLLLPSCPLLHHHIPLAAVSVAFLNSCNEIPFYP